MISFDFNNHFAALGDEYYSNIRMPNFCKNPSLVHYNHHIGKILGLTKRQSQTQEFIDIFSGKKMAHGSHPLAMVYSGHQFGVWAGQLGDGRAILLGQVQDKHNQSWDIQLKGSGLTPYSRMGDGRAVMRSTIREYLCSAAMMGLNIPTTQALAIIASNEDVLRERIELGAILTRISPSHIRFGHFEHFFHHGLNHCIKPLADYVIAQHYEEKLSYQDWLADIVKRTAMLIAQWQSVGFAHGVMNSDNMSILGLTIDYGPFGFQDDFDIGFICNHSDDFGRYAYDQQATIALWNLHALAYALQDLIPYDDSKLILQDFQPIFTEALHNIMIKKLGIVAQEKQDGQLWQELLMLMQRHHSDYTLVFRLLAKQKNTLSDDFKALFNHEDAIEVWYDKYAKRMAKELPQRQKRMNSINPKYILRNWVAEYAIRQVEDQQDYTILDDMLKILYQPYQEHHALAKFAAPPSAEMKRLSVSCSS